MVALPSMHDMLSVYSLGCWELLLSLKLPSGAANIYDITGSLVCPSPKGLPVRYRQYN